MKYILLFFALFISGAALSQNQQTIEMNSGTDDVHLLLHETSTGDYSRIEFYTTPTIAESTFGLSGRWQIAARSTGLSTDAGKAMNFWYGSGSSGAGANKLSLASNGYMTLGEATWDGSTSTGVIQSPSTNNASDIVLAANDRVYIDLAQDGVNLGAGLYVRDASHNDVFRVFSVGGNAWLKGTLTQGSDRNRKENITRINGASILDKVAGLDISQWNYIDEDVPHIGPMAQDFYAAFGLGDTDKGIAAIDSDGIALAAIQALLQRIEALEARLKIREK